MGKVKRLRQKYHKLVKDKKEQEDKKETPGLSYDAVVSGTYDKIKISSNLDTNLFAGINIDINKLNTSLDDKEDDKVSVRSTAKSLKYDANGKLLKKEEKRKLRHEHFMEKLNCFYQLRNEEKNKKKKKNSDKKVPLENKIAKEFTELPTKKISVRATKKRSVEKVKNRQKNMLKDMSAFQKIIGNSKFKSNPLGFVTNSVINKVLEDVYKS